MKSLKLFGLMMLFASIMMVSCGKEDDKGTCADGIKNQDETDIDCGGVCTACLEGVQGKWKSFPVAPILANFADSIIAEFKPNNTYTVDQWKGGTKVNLTGTYVQTKSNVGAIYTIKISQATPTVISAEGILEVSADNKSMKYELLQTEPSLGLAPPTPAGGFGSTAGGAFATNNVQNYVRVK
jgi:hypothetical protein